MWLVTKRCGINFLLGDLVNTTTISSNLRVPGLLFFRNIFGKTRFEFLGPVCRARRAEHSTLKLCLVIVVLRRRLPFFRFNIGDR